MPHREVASEKFSACKCYFLLHNIVPLDFQFCVFCMIKHHLEGDHKWGQ